MTSVILKLGRKMTKSPKNTIKSKLKGIKMVEAANTTVVVVAAACESTHVCAPPATWEEWIVDMRKNRYLCVSTNCLLLMHSKFAPVLFSSRTRAASLIFIRRFLKRNRLTVWRITHKDRKKRSDMKAVANVFSHSILRTVEEDGILFLMELRSIHPSTTWTKPLSTWT
ncbi:hypothetical protein PI126_g9562 [Phytophthora idaei]|nr:hypothetical protein PI126_g9562 [Phytophthora idaei]